jgi:hypothetical protein
MVPVFGVAAGFAATLVLTLYFRSEIVYQLYKEPALLWLLFPVFQYWIARVWLLTARRQMHDDPILFAVKDRPTYAAALICLLILAAAKWGWIPLSALLRR